MTTNAVMLKRITQDLAGHWKSLFLIDILYKLLALVLLTPLLGVIYRTMIELSGRTILADEDIVAFLLGPLGWVSLILVGSLGLGIVACELSSLLAILAGRSQGNRLEVAAGIGFVIPKVWPILQVTLRITLLSLLAAAPFVALAGLTYVTLLDEFDINFYLAEQPPVFWTAVGIGAGLAIGLALVALRLASSWFLAIPLVLFENMAPKLVLGESKRRVTGARTQVLMWIAGWFALSTLAGTLATILIGIAGRTLLPDANVSLSRLLLSVGALVSIWGVLNLLANLLSSVSFSAMLFEFYRQLGGSDVLARAREREPATSTVTVGGFQLNRRTVAWGALGACLVSFAVGFIAVESVQIEDRAEVTAHRGASGVAPENTMAAIQAAIDAEADWVEIDVQEIADGQVVVFHDSDFKRLAGQPLKIWDATPDDLAQLDIGSWFSDQFAGQRVPYLKEVLKTCRGKIKVNIELKYYGHDQDLERKVASLVEEQRMQGDVIVMSLKAGAVSKMKQLRPEWQVGLLTAVSASDLTNADADFLAVNATLAKRGFVRRAQEKGKDVFVWTVNDAASMSTMIGRGVDNLITDEPALARAVLEERAELNQMERFLVWLAGVVGTEPKIAQQ